MKPILRLKQVRENSYGYDTIEILAFNIDGKGQALVYCCNKKEKLLSFFGTGDLELILFGDPGSGELYYKEIKT